MVGLAYNMLANFGRKLRTRGAERTAAAAARKWSKREQFLIQGYVFGAYFFSAKMGF